MSLPVDIEFTKALPKIELHAHLTGSITRQCLHEIWENASAYHTDWSLEDPLIAIPAGKIEINAYVEDRIGSDEFCQPLWPIERPFKLVLRSVLEKSWFLGRL